MFISAFRIVWKISDTIYSWHCRYTISDKYLALLISINVHRRDLLEGPITNVRHDAWSHSDKSVHHVCIVILILSQGVKVLRTSLRVAKHSQLWFVRLF